MRQPPPLRLMKKLDSTKTKQQTTAHRRRLKRGQYSQSKKKRPAKTQSKQVFVNKLSPNKTSTPKSRGYQSFNKTRRSTRNSPQTLWEEVFGRDFWSRFKNDDLNDFEEELEQSVRDSDDDPSPSEEVIDAFGKELALRINYEIEHSTDDVCDLNSALELDDVGMMTALLRQDFKKYCRETALERPEPEDHHTDHFSLSPPKVDDVNLFKSFSEVSEICAEVSDEDNAGNIPIKNLIVDDQPVVEILSDSDDDCIFISQDVEEIEPISEEDAWDKIPGISI